MKAWIPVSLVSIWALAHGLQVSDYRSEIHPQAISQGLDAHETHASVSLLGQFRTSISSWLWLRSDLYLHNGVVMRPLTEAERLQGNQGASSTDNMDNALHNDETQTTVVPSADRDFRGVFGDIERQTKAYKDMKRHTHNNPQRVLPLFRLMTWIDPAFTPGWVVGSSIIARKRTPEAYQKAVDYLLQGLDKNPSSLEIMVQLGEVYVARQGDYRRSTMTFVRAIETAGNLRAEQLEPEQQEALLSSYRWLAICYRNTGMLEHMYAVLDRGLQKFPEDPVMERMAHEQPYVLKNRSAEPDLPPTEEHDHDHDHDH